MYICIYCLTQTTTVAYYMIDPSLDREDDSRQDGMTDWPTGRQLQMNSTLWLRSRKGQISLAIREFISHTHTWTTAIYAGVWTC
jgi:hypothetical protein